MLGDRQNVFCRIAVLAPLCASSSTCPAHATTTEVPQQVVSALHRIGLDSLRLSGTGVSDATLANFLVGGLNPTRLNAVLLAEASCASAYAVVSAAEHAITTSGTTPLRSEAVAAARAVLAVASVDRDARLIAAREHTATALTDSIGPEAGALARRAMTTVGRDLPAEWCFLDVPPDGLATLERAARKARLGRELTEAEATAVAAAESSPIVTLARGRIEANAATIREVFSQVQSLPPAP